MGARPLHPGRGLAAQARGAPRRLRGGAAPGRGGAARRKDGTDDRNAQACALARLVLKAVALATGAGVTVLTLLDEVEPKDALGLLGIGLTCLAISQIAEMDED